MLGVSWRRSLRKARPGTSGQQVVQSAPQYDRIGTCWVNVFVTYTVLSMVLRFVSQLGLGLGLDVGLVAAVGIDLDLGKIESAKNIMAQSNIRNSNHWFVHFQKARLAFLTGDLIKANELLDNNPPRMDSFAPAIRLAGEVAFKLGRCEYALSRAQRALGSDPNDKLASKLLQDAEQALADKDSKICS